MDVCFEKINKSVNDIINENDCVIRPENFKKSYERRFFRHINQTIKFIEGIHINPEEDFNLNIEKRIQYMNNITKEKIKIAIQQNEKKNLYNLEIYSIVDCYINCVKDVYYK
jgi:hypothetical protein